MTTAKRRAWLAGLEGRTAQLPRRKGRVAPAVVTELDRLTARAWGSYVDLVSRRPIDPVGAPVTEETEIRRAHAHQLLRSVSFAQTAGSNPEALHENLMVEMHQIFAADHPGTSRLGYEASSYHWHADKHPDALALYERLCQERHL